MGKNQKNPTYEDLLLPEHQDVLSKSAAEKVGLNIPFTKEALRHLFTLSAHNLKEALQEPPSEEIDINDIPIDDRLKKALTDPDRQALPARPDKNALLRAFCLMGAASNLGREVKLATMELDADGQITNMAGSGTIDPRFFDEFASDPLSGAQLLFGDISEKLHNPEQLLVLGFISPNPLMN